MLFVFIYLGKSKIPTKVILSHGVHIVDELCINMPQNDAECFLYCIPIPFVLYLVHLSWSIKKDTFQLHTHTPKKNINKKKIQRSREIRERSEIRIYKQIAGMQDKSTLVCQIWLRIGKCVFFLWCSERNKQRKMSCSVWRLKHKSSPLETKLKLQLEFCPLEQTGSRQASGDCCKS